MYRFLLFGSVIVFALFIPKEEAATKCRSRLNCTQPNASFCCKENSAWYSPFVCLPTCADRTCEDDAECGGIGGECCNTVDKRCTTKRKCLKACDDGLKCVPGTYCCQQTGFDPQICAKSCVGKTCNFDSDCGPPGECCTGGGECAKSCESGVPTWLIVVFVVVGILCVVGLALVIFHFARRSPTCCRRQDSLTPLVS
ncbi:Hypothetical predicted protein [Paramuricea clavata]|uniref:Uncharacterized protein n=2 Tax=Paramuricea clavata TaxID=317549 RepID=A0A6S7K4G2_PARCT|nr:Hypothetical predicted protein [Paramuricea clavata]